MSDASITNLSARALLGTQSTNKKSSKSLEATQKLQELAAADTTPLLTFETVFPFEFFPDKITIDRNKVTVHRKYSFFESGVESVLVKDIMTIVVEESLMFSAIRIVDRMPTRQVITVDHLPKDKARQARWIIQGLIVSSQQQGLDLTKIPNAELLPQLIEIGKSKTP